METSPHATEAKLPAPEQHKDGEAQQADMLRAFERGEVQGVGAPQQRIDTHLSHVFLTAEKVFKLKRAVTLPFVDFSTCAKRRLACEAELAVNRLMAAPLYLGVSAVTRREDGGFELGGEGAVVDWLVVMRRFDGATQFDRMAKAGTLTPPIVKRAGEIIARMHESAPVEMLAGHAADYRHVIRDLAETERDGAQRLGLEPASPRLFEALDAELVRVDALIEERRARGKVRRGHGDLHLRNICMFEGEPLLFDALEFDRRMASTDVLYDLAFLLMDLRRAGLPAHANAAMNAYWDASGEDESALELLAFFMALRATVRMAVAVEAGDLAEADAYRKLGLELLHREAPVLLAIGGLSGSGKSAVAASVAPRLSGPAGARLLRSDVIRKHALGLAPDAHADAATYAPRRRAAIYEALTTHAREAVSAGVSAIADATFQTTEARTGIERAAPVFHAVWLDVPLDLRLQRIAGRRGDASDADAAIAKAQQEPEAMTWPRIDASGDVDAVASLILKVC